MVVMAMLATGVVKGQAGAVDSAEVVISRYMQILNYEALRADSIFYMETIIYKRSKPDDTAILKRWFRAPNLFRAELWHGDTLLQGCYTNGKNRYRMYDHGFADIWSNADIGQYYFFASGFDFRGALYQRKSDGSEFRYDGVWEYKGHEVYKIYAEAPERYNRYYLFEKESGLLFLIEETNHHSAFSNNKAFDHPDLHGFHEYQPFRGMIIPSIESYQMEGDMLFYYSSFDYQSNNNDIFEKD